MDAKIIIGSGLSGPLLSILLTQENYNVSLFEKRPDIRKNMFFSGRSINLALSHRGIKALQKANIFDEIIKELIPMKGRLIHGVSGDTHFHPYSINKSEYINSISRNKLNQILLNKAEESGKVKIYFEHSLSKIQNNELIFENEKNYKINNNIVFGADGYNSVVRSYIDNQFNEKTIIEPLGHSYKELSISPSINGDFKLDSNVLHIWPRDEFMLIALPNTDGSFTCTLFLPSKGKLSFESLKTISIVRDFFKKYFSDVIDLIDDFPYSFMKNPTGALGSIKSKNWNLNNKFCLIGDSAHAIVPFFGQGMNAAFEDCTVLMDYFNKFSDKWESIIPKFCLNRMVDSQAISKMALDNYKEMRNSVSQNKYKIRKKISDILHLNFSNYFIPKYNMVSFTSIPYSKVYNRSKIQDEILDQLEDDFSMKRAKELIYNRLTPLK